MKIALKERKLPSGKISLLIEYYKGSEISLEGKRKHIRDYENLKLYLYGSPKNAIERKENKESMELAKKILAIREAEYHQDKFDLKSTTKGKRRFLDFFSEKVEERYKSPKNYGNWSFAFLHLQHAPGPKLSLHQKHPIICHQPND